MVRTFCDGLLTLQVLLAMATTSAQPLAPHQHGYADLNVVIDHADVDLTLESPLYNLLTFEHPPVTAAEQGKARQMVRLLQQADRLFVFSPAAGCRLTGVQLQSPALPATMLAEPSASAATQAQVPHHANLTGRFHFHCAQPAALGQLRVELFNPFLYLTVVKVVVNSDKGQKAALLTSDRNTIPF